MSRLTWTSLTGALGLVGLLGSLSGCASAQAAPEATDSARPAGAGGETRTADEAAPSTGDAPDQQPLATPSDAWTERGQGAEGQAASARRVRLLLPSSRLEAIAAAGRPALPARARLALVTARDSWLVRAPQALLDLGRELDDPRLAPVVALGAISGDRPQVDLEALADEADAQGFDLLLVDVRRGVGPERDGLLLHATTGALLAVFEVRGGALPVASVPDSGDDLLDRVGQAYARAR